MAVNAIFQENGKNNRARVVPEGTVAGDFLLISGRPAVAYTDRGDAVRTYAVADGVSLTRPSGGVGFAADESGVAFDGTWDLPVTGALTTTVSDVAVYFIPAVDAVEGQDAVIADPEANPPVEAKDAVEAVEAVPASLTLTAEAGVTVLFGYTDYPQENYLKRAGVAPVRIGA